MRAMIGAASHGRSAPAVDHEPAVVKQADADAGARAAIEPDRIGRDIERKTVQRRTPAATASASCVPEPSPACAGTASRTAT